MTKDEIGRWGMMERQEKKFRAWDKKLKKYHYFEGIFNDRPYTERSTFPQYQSSPEYHQLEIEQCTGLHDKDGKDLDWYAGDIIQKGSIVRALTIDWEHGLRFMLGKHQLCKQDAINGIKIGNVHENPLLIEKS